MQNVILPSISRMIPQSVARMTDPQVQSRELQSRWTLVQEGMVPEETPTRQSWPNWLIKCHH